jgi:nucleoside-diphosphate-sugar epimerase
MYTSRRGRWRLLALTSSPARHRALREAGIVPLAGDLDRPETLSRLAGLADAVLHLAPPAATGAADARTARLIEALARSPRLGRVVYASTSGVYGDCGGARVDETRRLAPATDRARRRADAEARLRRFGRTSGVTVTLLRIPGIYALDRPGGDPRERLLRGTPVLAAEDDVYTNHIHADDLARACIAALEHGSPQRAVNVSDDSELKMGEYFDLAADLHGLPRPPRLARGDATAALSPLQLSFLGESRRLVNRRLKEELGVVLHHETVIEGLRASPD